MEVCQGHYAVGDSTVSWTTVPTDPSCDELVRQLAGKCYEIACWRQGQDGHAEIVTWEVPAPMIDVFLFDPEGELGTVVSIREVQPS